MKPSLSATSSNLPSQCSALAPRGSSCSSTHSPCFATGPPFSPHLLSSYLCPRSVASTLEYHFSTAGFPPSPRWYFHSIYPIFCTINSTPDDNTPYCYDAISNSYRPYSLTSSPSQSTPSKKQYAPTNVSSPSVIPYLSVSYNNYLWHIRNMRCSHIQSLKSNCTIRPFRIGSWFRTWCAKLLIIFAWIDLSG